MEKCKTKAIQADLGKFTQILAYSDIFKHKQVYSRISRGYSEPSVTLAYLEPWYIQNPGTFRKQNHIHKLSYIQNPDIFRTLVYLEPLVYSDEKTTNLFNWYFSQ